MGWFLGPSTNHQPQASYESLWERVSLQPQAGQKGGLGLTHVSAKGLPCLPASRPWVPLNGARSSAGHVNRSAQQAPQTADYHRKPSPLVRDLLPAFLRLLSIKGVAKQWAVSGAHSWLLSIQKACEVVVRAVKGLVRLHLCLLMEPQPQAHAQQVTLHLPMRALPGSG